MSEQQKSTGAVWALIQAWMDSLPYPPSQRKLADRVGVAPNTITNWKYREAMPAPDQVEALAREIGVRYERVLDAFLADHGYLWERPTQAPGREVTGT